jgi:hypothetical protein
MQYEISHHAVAPDPESLESLLHAIDTGALVDRDPQTGGLRISSVAAADEVIEVLRRAGFEVSPSQLTRLPSQCCGGCGG